MNIDGYIYVLETNFQNYAVIMACGIVNKRDGLMVWILGRSSYLTSQYLNRTHEVLKENKISQALIKSNQMGCPNYVEVH